MEMDFVLGIIGWGPFAPVLVGAQPLPATQGNSPVLMAVRLHPELLCSPCVRRQGDGRGELRTLVCPGMGHGVVLAVS